MKDDYTVTVHERDKIDLAVVCGNCVTTPIIHDRCHAKKLCFVHQTELFLLKTAVGLHKHRFFTSLEQKQAIVKGISGVLKYTMNFQQITSIILANHAYVYDDHWLASTTAIVIHKTQRTTIVTRCVMV